MEPGGVNTDPACPSTEPPTVSEVLLVTFSWSRDSTSAAAKKTASWVAVGEGTSMELVRRYCENEAPQDEQVLARSLGVAGLDPFDIVHGPGTPPQDFCPLRNSGTVGDPVMISDECTITVDGRFDYSLSVARRVPDLNGNTANPLAPAKPTITGAVGRNTFVTVSWAALSAPPGHPVLNYRVLAFLDPNGSSVASVEVGGSELLGDVTGLTNFTQYYFKVQAKNDVGYGSLSAAFGPVTPVPTAPEAPTITSVTSGDGSIALTWTPNANNGGSPVTSWNMYVKPVNGPIQGPTVQTPGSSTSGVVSGLSNDTKYEVYLAAVNAAGEGIWSNAVAPAPVMTPYAKRCSCLPPDPTATCAR